MKRFLHFVWVLSALSAMLASCDDASLEGHARVSLDGLKDSYEFEAEPAGVEMFEITSNVNWTLELEDLDWMTFKPGRGLASSRPQTVTMQPAKNLAELPRTGTMTVRAGDFSRKVTFTQKAQTHSPELTFEEGVVDDVLYIDAYNLYGSYVKLYCNRDWEAFAENMDEWALVGPLAGEQGRFSTVLVKPLEPNTDATDRVGEIIFTFDGLTKTLIVRQKAFVAKISVLKDGESVTSVPALSVGETLSLTVDSSGDWTAAVTDGGEWLSLDVSEGGYGNAAVSLRVDPNTTGRNRTGKVAFDNNGEKIVLTVSQGNEFIFVSEENFTLKTEGESRTIQLSANVEWEAEVSDTWLKVDKMSGNSSSDITITADPAANDNVRTGTVIFRAKEISEIFKTVTVTQSASFIDLWAPLLFNSSVKSWNMAQNPGYASAGQTGVVSGEGTGRVCSYTYPENEMCYAQVVSPNPEKVILYIMSDEGNITFKRIWTKDAIEFHIPVVKVNKDVVLHFEYGVMGTSQCPKYWNAEITLNGGSKWESFTTGVSETSAGLGEKSNTVLPGTSNTEEYYKATYKFSKTVEQAEIIVRIICVDGTIQQNGTVITAPDKSGTFRILGADHDYKGDANKDVVKGPKFYLK